MDICSTSNDDGLSSINFWSYSDLLFTFFKDNNVPKETKIFVAKHYFQVSSRFLSSVKASDVSTQTFIRDFLLWLTRVSIELLTDDNVDYLHAHVINVATFNFSYLIDFINLEPIDVFCYFYNVFKESQSYFSGTEESRYFNFPEEPFLPRYIKNREQTIDLCCQNNLLPVHFLFVELMEIIIPGIRTSYSFSMCLIQILSDIMEIRTGPLLQRCIRLSCMVYQKIHLICDSNDVSLLKHLLEEYRILVRDNLTDVEEDTHISIISTLQHIVNLNGKCYFMSSIFGIIIEILNTLYLLYHDEIFKKTFASWAEIASSVLNNAECSGTEISDVDSLVDIIYDNKYMYLLIEEYMKQSLQSIILNKTSNPQKSLVNVHKELKMWSSILLRLELIIHPENFSEYGMETVSSIEFIVNTLNIVHRLKTKLESNENVLVFFPSHIISYITILPSAALKVDKSWGKKHSNLIIELLHAVVLVSGKEIKEPNPIFVFLLVFLHENDVIKPCIKFLCLEILCVLSLLFKQDAYMKVITDHFANNAMSENDEIVNLSLTTLVYFWLSSNDIPLSLRILEVLKNILMLNIDLFFRNEIVGKYFLCILDGQCFLKIDSGFTIGCIVCDKTPAKINSPPCLLSAHINHVSERYMSRLLNREDGFHPQMFSFVSNYVRHSPHLRFVILEQIGTIIIKPELKSSLPILNHVLSLVKDENKNIDSESVKYLYREAFNMLTNLDSLPYKMKNPTFKKIIRLILQVANVPTKEFILPCLKLFMAYCVGENLDFFSSIKLLSSVYNKYDIKIKDLFIKNEMDMSKFLYELMVYYLHTKKYSVADILIFVARVLGIKRDDSAKLHLLKYIVPHIMLNLKLVHIKFIYSGIIRFLQKENFQVLSTMYFEDLFCSIYFKKGIGRRRKKMIFSNFLSMAPNDLVTMIYLRYNLCIARITLDGKKSLDRMEFLFQVSSKESMEISKDSSNNKSNSETNMECEPYSEDSEVSEVCYLKQNIIGLLAVLDSKLTSPESSKYVVKQCLKALVNYMEMLGPDVVTENRTKIINTLRNGVRIHYDEYPYLCLKTWLCFCFSVDLYVVAPHLSTIFLQLLPLYDRFSVDVSNVFYYLVVDNSQACAEFIPDLYFVPDDPKNEIMHCVWKSIKSAFSDPCDFQEHILRTAEHILIYDNVEAIVSGLNQLHKFLVEFGPKLYDSILNNDRLEPIYEQIISCVMDTLKYKDPEIKTTCALCLGELGALDPSRFSFRFKKDRDANKIYNICDKRFAANCISVMIRVLVKLTDKENTTKIVGSIQELFRIYFTKGCEEDMKYFTTTEKDILEPLQRTRFLCKPPKIKLRKFHEIMFGSHIGCDPKKWAFKWSRELLKYVPQSEAKKNLKKCLPCFRIDLQIVETILPHIVLHAVMFGRRMHVRLIEKEIKSILHWDIEKDRLRIPSNFNLFKSKKKCKNISIPSEEKHRQLVALILELLDFLHQSYIDIKYNKADLGIFERKGRIKNLKYLLDNISLTGLSMKSYVQRDFFRSLFYFERCFDGCEIRSSNLFPLRSTYAKLNDVDGLMGVMLCGKENPTIDEQMLRQVISGTIKYAVNGYEHLGMRYRSTYSYRVLIQSYLSINQAYSAVRLSKTVMSESFYLEPSLYNDYIEALWNTDSCCKLNEVLNEAGPELSNNWCWGIDLINAFQHLKNLNVDKMESKINSMRCRLIECLAQISNKSIFKYRQGYGCIIKLHILNEMTKFANLLEKSCGKRNLNETEYNMFLKHLLARFQLLPSHGHFTQEILQVRQQCIKVAIQLNSRYNFTNPESLLKELGKICIQSVKMERKNGSLINAYSNLVLAEIYSPPDLLIQKAKYYKANNEIDAAVFELKQGVRRLLTEGVQCNEENERLHARAKMLIAKYDTENTNLEFRKGYESLREATSLCHIEQNFVYLAQYLYKQHLKETDPDKNHETRDMQYKAALYFSMSLLYGCKYIYQSMSCFVSLWLNFAARVSKDLPLLQKANQTESRLSIMDTLHKFSSLIVNSMVCLPSYMFMTVLSQILPRINHPSLECFERIKEIVKIVFHEYPQQTMWSIVPVLKTESELRKKRVQEMLLVIRKDKGLERFMCNFIEFINNLINISNKKPNGFNVQMKLESVAPDFRRKFKSRFASIMIPLQRFRTIAIPNYKNCNSVMERIEHNPFPYTMVYFKDVLDEIEVLHSIQRPKKLTFIGTDGNYYPLLCKHMDDLRLDSRIMEFNSIINLYLRRDPTARDRGLLIRTYGVVPLNNECGLIEWLHNLSPFKCLLWDIYKHIGIIPMKSHEIKANIVALKDPLSKKKEIFENVLLAKHPPVLHKWFFQAFPRSDVWYLARTNYIRTLAVMSIVGYIVGLGDRHCDNILVDTTTGEIVHVDFNCLFNKGETFPYPETVPFRLTQNLVKALGPTGVEGHFYKSCEITTRVLRNNQEQLLSVIKPFLYDDSSTKLTKAMGKESSINEVAKINIANVQKRLSGVVRTKSSHSTPVKETCPLSVEGQIRGLVEEATKTSNLCQLFHGWAAYL